MSGWCLRLNSIQKRQARILPSLDKEGWPRPQENVAKHPYWERTEWFVQLPIIGGLNQPLLRLRAVALALRARLRKLRWLREVFLIAQPPLLNQGEEYSRPYLFADSNWDTTNE
jgi:hypothetical protein